MKIHLSKAIATMLMLAPLSTSFAVEILNQQDIVLGGANQPQKIKIVQDRIFCKNLTINNDVVLVTPKDEPKNGNKESESKAYIICDNIHFNQGSKLISQSNLKIFTYKLSGHVNIEGGITNPENIDPKTGDNLLMDGAKGIDGTEVWKMKKKEYERINGPIENGNNGCSGRFLVRGSCDGNNGANGVGGYTGENGEDGSEGLSGLKNIDINLSVYEKVFALKKFEFSSNGTPGGKGGNGGAGENGGNGTSGTDGGNGGDGELLQSGGDGGDGGAGGIGGNGGNGGKGGDGGDGGDGGNVTIIIKEQDFDDEFTDEHSYGLALAPHYSLLGGKGGAGGAGGGKGAPGVGGYGGFAGDAGDGGFLAGDGDTGTSGNAADSGNAGKFGEPGKPGKDGEDGVKKYLENIQAKAFEKMFPKYDYDKIQRLIERLKKKKVNLH